MKMPRPTKNAEQGTAGQGTAIVPDTASASKTPGCAIGTTMLALVDALNTAVLRAWCASPSGWGRATVRVGAAKHYGSEARKSVGAAAVPNLDSGFFTPMRCAWHTWLSFLAGRVGTPARVCRFLLPVDQPCTVCHPCLVAGVAGFKPVQ